MNKHINAVLEIVKKTNHMKEIAANYRSEFDGVQYYDYTDEYKRRKKQEINERLAADLNALLPEVDEHLQNFVNEEREKEFATVDYADPRFIAAVNAIQTMGASMPREIADAIYNDMRSQRNTRKVLADIAEKNRNFGLSAMLNSQNLNAQPENVARAISDMMYYDAMKPEQIRADDVERIYTDYAVQYGEGEE